MMAPANGQPDTGPAEMLIGNSSVEGTTVSISHNSNGITPSEFDTDLDLYVTAPPVRQGKLDFYVAEMLQAVILALQAITSTLHGIDPFRSAVTNL